MKKLRLNKGFTIPRIGLGGRLALLWWDNLDIDAQTSSPNHINTLVNQDGVIWRFIGFYGHHETSRRGESWDLLCHLNTLFSLPWLSLGDSGMKFY